MAWKIGFSANSDCLFTKYLPALVPPLANVELHGAEGVDGETLVGVDGDTEEAGVGVDQLVLVPDHGVPEDASVTEESEVSHVLRVVELGGVDLAAGETRLSKRAMQTRSVSTYTVSAL